MRRPAAALGLVILLVAFAPSAAPTQPTAAPAAPTGVTAIALSATVELAWQPVADATAYQVYRGTSPGTITTRVTPTAGVSTTSFADTTAVNGTTYYYVARAVAAGLESGDSLVVQATPVARSCSTGNAVVLENCFPGNTGWRTTNPQTPSSGGIEGFATATSVNKGGSVDLKINATNGAPYRIEIYRSGYYGGQGARLFSVIRGLAGVAQPSCSNNSSTGLVDCSNWAVSATVTTTSSWPSGVYLLRLVRTDTNTDHHILLVIRDDARSSDVLYGVSFATYQAYNSWGGRSLYDFNSSGANTVAGTPQAVKVSFDRPFKQPPDTQDWYPRLDYQNIFWLERSGYDLSYASDTDLEATPSLTLGHRAYMLSSHDEYWSAGMRTAVTQARDNGVSLFSPGADQIFWKIRFEASPGSGAQNRVEVCYKTTQTGVADPGGTTTLWRDPAGANNPENALLGSMFIGQNIGSYFPIVVTTAQGTDSVYRYTSLASLPPGSSGTVGSNLVGWEWDGRVANGREPTGLVTLSSSPVNGSIFQSSGYSFVNGSATVNSTKYRAASGALVFNAGSIQWARGLAVNADGVGEPNVIIQQTETNILADMNVRPATPAPNITLDPTGPPTVTATTPADGASGVSTNTSVTATFSRAMDPSTITAASFTLKTPGGATVPASVSYNPATTRATLTPSSALATSTTYTAALDTSVKATDGTPLTNAVTWSFTTATAPPPPPTVTATTPAAGATGVSAGTTVTATFSRAMDPATITGTSFTLSTGSTTVPASVTYDGATTKATLTPSANLATSTTYTARLDTTIKASDGTALANAVTWSFTTGVSGCPCSLFASSAHPAVNNAPTQDGRSGSGPWSYELGVKVRVDQPMQLTAIRYYKQSLETGTHVGRVWSLSGTQLAQVTFTGETASGWQQQALSTPLALQANTTYIVSVNANAYFGATVNGLATQVNSGPLHSVADGFNGVYGPSAGVFPTLSYSSSNYFTDVVVADAGPPDTTPPTVSLTAPAAGATVSGSTTVGANASDNIGVAGVQFKLDGVALGAEDTTSPYSISWDTTQATNGTHSLTAVARDAAGNSTTSAAVSVTVSNTLTPPTVTSTVPADGAAGVSTGAAVTATFSRSMDGTTITTASFTLVAGSTSVPATVSYNDTTRKATLTPSGPLASGTAHTARLATSIKAADGTPLANAVSWSFTTAASVCPCSLFSPTQQPAVNNSPTQDGRSGSGPWSYELGVKIRLDQPMQLTAIRFYKQSLETGTHVGRVWTTAGAQVAQVTFVGESGSGWQQQAFATPVDLQANTTYVVSINANAYFGATANGLATQVNSGPLHSVADGVNGVFGPSAGVFPTLSYSSSNYFTDVVVADPAPPDTTPPTVSLTAPSEGNTISDTTNVTATAADNVGVAGVQFKLDGANLGTEDFAAPYAYSWDTTTATNGTHTLTAVARDAAGNTTTSAAVHVTVNNANSPSQIGSWSAPAAWPIVAVHMSLLPTGNVIAYDGFAAAPDSERIWNPSDGTFTPVPYGRNLFCAGHVLLPDGRTLIVGGHINTNVGLADTTVFNASTNTWTRLSDMAVGRWYPTATVLGDGRVFVFAGDSISQDLNRQPRAFAVESVDSLPEVFDPSGNTWLHLTGSTLTTPLYPRMFVLSDGRLIDVGPDTVTRTITPGTWTWQSIGTSPFDGYSAVMYRPDKIMKSGSFAVPGFNGANLFNTSARTAVLDMTQASPAWRETSAMNYPRAYQNLTMLPDGAVLASGGTTTSDGTDITKAVLPAEIWDPNTETWKVVASLHNGREYHSTALLLPDGRVLMAGGGQLPGSPAVDETNAEIYSPPYLFKGARPTISSVQTQVLYGSSFTVTTPDAASISSVALVRTPSVTHGFDMNGRYVPLSFSKGSGELTVQAPANGNITPPGYYMLFIVNSNGVPSVASFVRFPAPWEDATPPSAPTGLAATSAGGNVSLTWNASSDNVGVSKYDLYRSTTAGFTPSGSNRIAQPAGTSFTDGGLSAGTYYYKVKAEDAAGNLSNASNEASATVSAGPPTVSSTTPANGATGVGTSAAITATFSRAMDATTITGTSFTLSAGGSSVPASVSYNSSTLTATLTPSAALSWSTTYTAQLSTAVKAADGAALAAAVTWSFTTAANPCPCSLFSAVQQPAVNNAPTQDGRTGSGPWSYELGVKIRVDQPLQLSAIRFYKQSLETGSHVGRVWSAGGALLGQATFTNETSSGWQQQALTTPISLQANTTYVVSINANAYFGLTANGLASQIDSGPLHSIVGQNGVYGSSAGVFPSLSYSSSNYFTDVVVQ